MKPFLVILLLAFWINLLGCDNSTAPSEPIKPIGIVLIVATDSANPQDSIGAKFFNTRGLAPFAIGLHPKAGRTYFGTIRFGREVVDSDDSIQEITEEIRDAGSLYQIFLTPDSVAADYMKIEITDRDKRGLPLGLSFTLRTLTPHPDRFGSIDQLRMVVSRFNSESEKNGVAPSAVSDFNEDIPVRIER
jgi:hypothetical protein